MTTDPNVPAFTMSGALRMADGLTKRELLAAVAMHAILAGKATHPVLWEQETEEMTANQAVTRADALIEALNFQEPTP